MKRIIFSILMTFLAIGSVYCDPIEDVIEQSRQLVEGRQYKSAMDLLYSIDRNNSNKIIVIEKSKIFRNYFAQSINHKMFGLKDLEENENLYDLREKGGKFSLFLFDGIEILKTFLENENGEISNEIGLYYNSIYSGYRDSSNDHYGNVNALRYEYLDAAYRKYQYYDPISWEILGKYYYSNNKITDAFTIFNKLVENDPANPEYNFTYGLMLFNNRNYNEAIPFVEKAIENYKRSDYKYDAISMLGSIYYKIDDIINALENFEQVMESNPYDYRIYDRYVDCLIRNDEIEKAIEFSYNALLIEPDNSYIANALLPVYVSNNELKVFHEILEKCLNEINGNTLAEANFYFQIANVMIQERASQIEINTSLENARERYVKGTNGEHPAIEAINNYLENNE